MHIQLNKGEKLLKIKLCLGSSCFVRGNQEMLDFLENYAKAICGFELELSGCLCLDQCGQGPNLFINGHKYDEMTLDKMKEILAINE